MELLALKATARWLLQLREKHRKGNDPINMPTLDGCQTPVIRLVFYYWEASDKWPSGASFTYWLQKKRDMENAS